MSPGIRIYTVSYFPNLTSLYCASGAAAWLFRLNEPPVPGNCSVSPPSPSLLISRLNVHCTEPFVDDDVPLSYELDSLDSSGNWLDIFYGNDAGLTCFLLKNRELPSD